MIRSASLHTLMIDDPAAALQEIQGQLQEKLVLLRNTVGIVHCDFDFIESGVIAHLCDSLPFPLVGATSSAQATHEEFGSLMLTILVLTSDDVEFSHTHTIGLTRDLQGAMDRSVPASYEASSFPLQLVLTFAPMLEIYSGDTYINELERLYGQTPVFGTLATDDYITNREHIVTICNNQTFSDEVVYVLIRGNVTPRFFMEAVPQQAKLLDLGVITKAEDNALCAINSVRTIEVFENIKLAQNGVVCNGIESIPFMLSPCKNNEVMSRPFVRKLMHFDTSGTAFFRGAIYENTVLAASSLSSDDILLSATETTRSLNSEKNIHAVLVYSCISRRTVLANTPQIELEQVCKTIRPDIPFMMSYSGGEICPTSASTHSVENRFHNFTFVACAL